MEKLKTPTEGLSSVNVNGLKRFQLWSSAYIKAPKQYINDYQLLDILKKNAQTDVYINMRNHYSLFIKTGDEAAKIRYDSVKKHLEFVTLSCLMSSSRKAENMCLYKDSRIEEINQRLTCEGGVYEQRGSDVEKISIYHKQGFSRVKDYYEGKFGVKFDNAAMAVQGAAYVSADSNPYFNENAELFLVSDISLEKPAPEVKYTVCDCINNSYTTTTRSKAPEYTTSHCDILLEMVQWFEKYTKGRHNMIVKVTPQATTYSIPKSVIIDFFTELYEGEDFTIAEVERTVNDLYNQPPKINQYIITELYDKGCRAIKTT